MLSSASAKPFDIRDCFFACVLLIVIGVLSTTHYLQSSQIKELINADISSAWKRCQERRIIYERSLNDGQDLGKQLFNLASILYVAALTNRTPAIGNLTDQTDIEQVFDLHIERCSELCPYLDFHESHPQVYDKTLEEWMFKVPNNVTIRMGGHFQSWKYTRSIERHLRRNLVFRREIRDFVDQFLTANNPANWTDGFLRVGVHVQRDDVLTPEQTEVDYNTPNETYFLRAMKFYVELYEPRIQFIVVSNDMKWCQDQFPLIESQLIGNSSKTDNQRNSLLINVTYSIGHSAGEELALLASCDHVLMSTGTYGWWAAWLAKGTTVYYADWPRTASLPAADLSKIDFFPLSWIGMT